MKTININMYYLHPIHVYMGKQYLCDYLIKFVPLNVHTLGGNPFATPTCPKCIEVIKKWETQNINIKHFKLKSSGAYLCEVDTKYDREMFYAQYNAVTLKNAKRVDITRATLNTSLCTKCHKFLKEEYLGAMQMRALP